MEVLGDVVAEQAPEVYEYVQFVLRPAEVDAARAGEQSRLRAIAAEYFSLVESLALPGDATRRLLARLERASAPRVRVCLELVGGKLRETQKARRETLDGEYRELLKTELYALLAE